jgi:hypothetical protein
MSFDAFLYVSPETLSPADKERQAAASRLIAATLRRQA